MKLRRNQNKNDQNSEDDVNVNTKIFARKFPQLGWVPIGFYIPDCKSKYECRKLIEKHGGIVIKKYEAFTYQIKPEKD